jgi:hypothetical protein
MAPLMPDAGAVAMDAAPAGAKLAINPTAGDFGTVMIGGDSTPIDFTITNVGDAPSGVPTPTLTGDYLMEMHSCSAAMPPGGTCVARVKLHPVSAGNKPGMMTVFANPGGIVQVSLTGFGADAARLAVQQPDTKFGDVAPGTSSAPFTITIKNEGGLMSGQPSVALAGAANSEYTIASNGCTSPLASGAVCQVTVTFTPVSVSQLGLKEAQLDAFANPGGTTTGLLHGNSTFVSVTPNVHNFGNVMAGGANMGIQQFVVKHIGPAGSGTILLMSSIAQGADMGDFTLWNMCPSSLNPGENCPLEVDFKPRTTGQKNSLLDVAAHAATGLPMGTSKAGLTGNGI